MNKVRIALIISTGLAAGAVGVAFAASDSTQVPAQGTQEKTALLDSFGMSRADSQIGFRTPSGKQLYVNQSAVEACVTDADGTGHCAPRSRLAEGIGFGGELCRSDLPADEVRVTGVLPAGAEHVTLTTAGGSTFQANAVNDTVAFEVPRATMDNGKPVEVTWTTTNAASNTFSLPQPPIVANAKC